MGGFGVLPHTSTRCVYQRQLHLRLVTSALEQFKERPALGFSDCLVLQTARKAGHLPLGTFDRDLAKLDGAARLK